MPGPGAHDASLQYTTREHAEMRWSINRTDRNPEGRKIKHPGP